MGCRREISSTHRRIRRRYALPILTVLLTGAMPAVQAFEPLTHDNVTLTPTLNSLLGLQYGDNINYGLGALDAIGETERAVLYLALKPKLVVNLALAQSNLYAGVSVVAATTTLDGELSGQFARAGDEVLDTDHTYVGWRSEHFDLSFGAQEFSVGDGFIIGDGNFNQGGENGQYWTGAFAAWRNSAVLKINGDKFRADVFWLRTDTDFRDGRVVGLNVETQELAFGTLGAMYVEVLQGGAFNLDGINSWNLRGADIRVPGLSNLSFFGEWVLELGNDDQAGGRENQAVGWYLEGQYSIPNVAWTTRVNYRYARLSGDDVDTPENEEYRGLYFTIFKRDWDT
jgi:hypothetical protein